MRGVGSAESGRGAKALRGAAPTRGGSCVSGSKEPERFKDTHQCTEPIEILSVNHQNDGEESSELRSSAATGAAAGSRACCRSDTEGRCRVEPACGQRRGTHLVFGTEGANGSRPEGLRKLLRKTLTSKCSSWSIKKQLRTRLRPTRTPTVHPFRRQKNVLDCTATAAQQDTGLGKAIRGSQMELSVQRFTMSDMRRPFRVHSTAVEF